MCAKVAGCEAEVYNYESGEVGKGDFPFRENNFHVVPSKSVEELGWEGGEDNLEGDLKWYWEDFKKRGVKGKFDKDDEIMAAKA